MAENIDNNTEKSKETQGGLGSQGQNSRNGAQMPNGKQPVFGRGMRPNWNWIFITIFMVLIVMQLWAPDENVQKQVSYSKLVQLVEGNQLQGITVNTDRIQAQAEIRPDSVAAAIGKPAEKSENQRGIGGKIEGKKGKTYVLVNLPTVEETSKMLQEKGFRGEIKYVKEDDTWSKLLFTFGPIILLVALWIFMMRRMGGGGPSGGIFGVGKSKAKIYDKDNKVAVTFKDVAGLEGAKQEVEEIVDFLKNPKKYTDLGGKIPKGALLVGPPGTGKTLMAKAVAGEAGVPFFSMSGSDFVEMFVGVGASRVRDLFRQAKEKAPCIIFIDEIDAVGRARGSRGSIGGNDERENTLNQLLTEMDGFGTNSGVIILAATNRADVLDKALLRAGRFDRQIHVELPDLHERKAIFDVHLRKIKKSEDLDVDFLAKQTPGFSGADIANVCNEAALGAARNGKKKVDTKDFMNAVDRIVGGLEKKTKIMTEEEKRAIAEHEAGHATISWMTEHANPLVKVTIVPRGVALGAAWYLPEERVLTNKEHLLDELCSLLGGRAAEELFGKTASTGALNDLERATKMAYAMVTYYGMAEGLENLSYYDSTGGEYSGFTKPYSESTAEKIDEAVRKIIGVQYDRAKKILTDNKDGHHKIADRLVEKEVIFADDVKEILGERPWKSRADTLIEESEESGDRLQVTGDKENTEKKAEGETKEYVEPTETKANDGNE